MKNIIKLDKDLVEKNTMNEIKPKPNEEVGQKSPKTEEITSNIQKPLEKGKEDNSEIKKINVITLDIITKIGIIIEFSKNNNIFFLYFTNEFWKEFLKNNSEPDID